MENIEQESLFQMDLDNNGGQFLRQAARWSRFISIVFFILLAIILVFCAAASTMLVTLFSRFSPGFETIGSLGTAVIISVALIVCAIFGALAYQLYRFSVLTRRGIEQQDQIAFSKGMRALKNYFLISGTLAILSLLSNLFSLTKIFHS